jgi:7-cyano-7-deazaguanine reductase
MSEPSILETFPNPSSGRDYRIEHTFPEFTSVCPKTGQPDFGTVVINYVPDQQCVELKSLKFYLNGFRDQGIFYEAVTNKLLDDLVAVCQPRQMTVTTQWGPRGGLSSTVTASYGG